MAETSQINADSVLGRLVVEKGLATSEEVEQCLQLQRETTEDPGQRSLAEVLVENGVVTSRQLERLRPEVEEQRAGQQIPGFQIISKLGAGAMATVYKARQVSLDRLVAIKVLPRKYTKNQQFVERFYAEGRAAAKLNHPNIVGALDVGKAGEFHYFVMEHVEGHTVFDHINDHGRYEEQEALEIARHVGRALEHAHEQGFIHRDVKPKNIMITPEGTVKLADMGLARAVSDREAAEAEQGKAFGTPYYISPEQIRGVVDVDYRADIYGLGATLYHMLTGQVPFNGT
jgi:serine/threonine-protein kinase